ncbi:MAG: prepilin-type N-terminal cleavage/methylation domain-containing protein [Patescibacteria group bacterium]|nr:prepilin-type N-terminal cleavage/methylation domain-containing protein [Patescibacteria group bacterium]
MTSQERGFTLIELIITIAILAVLVTVLVVAINPAEQLARARDSKRVADLDAIKTAINLYLAQATTTINLSGDGTANQRCKGGGGSYTIFFNIATSTGISTSTMGASTTARNASTSQSVVNAAGWLPARIDQTPGGPAIANLPLDPAGTGQTSSYYAYLCDVTGGVRNFEINTVLESTYFKSDIDIDGTDGGNDSERYEVGTDPGLDL